MRLGVPRFTEVSVADYSIPSLKSPAVSSTNVTVDTYLCNLCAIPQCCVQEARKKKTGASVRARNIRPPKLEQQTLNTQVAKMVRYIEYVRDKLSIRLSACPSGKPQIFNAVKRCTAVFFASSRYRNKFVPATYP